MEVERMSRAVVVSLGLGLLLMWVVGLVDGSTWWLVWLDGVVAVLSFLVAAATSSSSGPVAASAGPGLLGVALGVLFILGLVANASAWLVWFTLAFAGGELALASLSFVARSVEPRSYSRTPISAH
jgi:hypothetical protein